MKLSENKNSSLLKSGTFLSFLTFFSRILGLMREMVKSRFLGTSSLADAFTVSFLIPNLLRRLFAENSMTVAFIPTFKELIETKKDEEQQKKDMKEFLSSIFTILTFFTSLIVIIGIIFAPLILHLLFPRLEDKASAILLTRIMFPYLCFISIAAFFQGILNGVKVFSPSGFTPILFNISVIGATYLLSKVAGDPAKAMSIGVLIGGFLQAMFQLPFVLKHKFFFSFTNLRKALCNTYTKKTLRLIAPTLIGMAAYQINDLVSTSLATGYGVGIASSLQYSLRLQELLLGVFVVSISSVILPDLSSYAIKTDWASFENLFLGSMKIIALITIPASFFAFFSSEEIVSVIYKSNKFDINSVNLTVKAFNCHILGLFFIALNRVIAPAFYAMHDSDSPTISGIASFFINIFFAYLLGFFFLGGGIAIALSIASFVNTVFLFFFLMKKAVLNIKSILKKISLFTLKITLFSGIAILPLYFFIKPLEHFLVSSFNVTTIFSFVIALIVMFIIFSLMGLFLLIITKDEVTLLVLRKLKIIKKDF